MPQLMPFMWINSVFMSFMLLFMLVFMYSFIKVFLYYIVKSVKCKNYVIEW